MQTSDNIKKKDSQLSEQDKKTLATLKEDINFILENPKITEEILKKLWNMSTTISSLRENYMWRILRATKQNHMLD